MNRDFLYVSHILECVQAIEDYTANGHEFYLEDQKTQDATLRNLQVLAESTQKLSDEIKSKSPKIPWREISGFRNILVHKNRWIRIGAKP